MCACFLVVQKLDSLYCTSDKQSIRGQRTSDSRTLLFHTLRIILANSYPYAVWLKSLYYKQDIAEVDFLAIWLFSAARPTAYFIFITEFLIFF